MQTFNPAVTSSLSPASGMYAPNAAPVTISCHENHIPPFVGAQLDQLYGNPYSSLRHLALTRRLDHAHTYVARSADQITAVFLFHHQRGIIEVLNEAIRIDGREISRFAEFAFAAFADARVITFTAIATDPRTLSRPHLRLNYLEDIVAELPESAAIYTASLGKKTRANMRRSLKLIRQAFPTFSFQTHENDAAAAHLVRDIIALSSARMSARKKATVISDREAQELQILVEECGLAGVISINGRVCAGTIACRAGNNYFLRVLAHDPLYDKYSLGRLCCYLTICECIERGAHEFHFLWGRSDYKYMFAGVQRDLDHLLLFRARRHMFRHAALTLRACLKWVRRQARLRLLRILQDDSAVSRFVSRVVNFLQGMRRA